MTPPGLTMYVPLKFWFNRTLCLALPLIALQYHEVKVKLATRSLLNLLNSDNNTGNAATIIYSFMHFLLTMFT